MTTRTVPVSCNLDCGGGCPLLAHIEGGRVARITKQSLGQADDVRLRKGTPDEEGLVRPPIDSRSLCLELGPGGRASLRRSPGHRRLTMWLSGCPTSDPATGTNRSSFWEGVVPVEGALHNTGSLTRRFLGMFGGLHPDIWQL